MLREKHILLLLRARHLVHTLPANLSFAAGSLLMGCDAPQSVYGSRDAAAQPPLVSTLGRVAYRSSVNRKPVNSWKGSVALLCTSRSIDVDLLCFEDMQPYKCT